MSTFVVIVQQVMFLLTVLVSLTAPTIFVMSVLSLTSVVHAQPPPLSTAIHQL